MLKKGHKRSDAGNRSMYNGYIIIIIEGYCSVPNDSSYFGANLLGKTYSYL